MSVMVRFLALSVCDNYSKSSIKPPRGLIYLKPIWGLGLLETGACLRGGGGGVLLIEFSKEGGISSP